MADLRRAWPVATVTGLVGLVVFASATGSPLSGRAYALGEINRGKPGSASIGTGFLGNLRGILDRLRPGSIDGWPGDLFVVVAVTGLVLGIVGGVAIVLYGIGWLLARLRVRLVGKREANAPLLVPDAEAAPADVVLRRFSEAVARGLAELDEGDPRASVIVCWLRVQDAAAAAGTLPLESETARELVVRVLSALRVQEEPLQTLADLFDEARFSAHAVDQDMRAKALAALGTLNDDLAGHQVAGR